MDGDSHNSSVDKHNARELRFLKSGEIIYCVGNSTILKIFYYHFALFFVNQGKYFVAHVTSAEDGHWWMKGGKAVVVCDDFWKFAIKKRVYRDSHWDKTFPPLPLEKILKAVEDSLGPMEYNLITHNCEHLVTKWRYGKPMSDQVPRLIAYLFPSREISAVSGTNNRGTGLPISRIDSQTCEIPQNSCTGSLSAEVEESRGRTSSKFCGTTETESPDEDEGTVNTSFINLGSNKPPDQVTNPAEAEAPAASNHLRLE